VLSHIWRSTDIISSIMLIHPFYRLVTVAAGVVWRPGGRSGGDEGGGGRHGEHGGPVPAHGGARAHPPQPALGRHPRLTEGRKNSC